ncbi:TIGR00282 family metallophosphoesterase [bacterium]|nr:TIGR00282 family metallophosphoesterase [bacterium]
MNILFIGDIFGRPGRTAVKKALPELRKRYEPDFIIANAENSAGGKGVNRKIVEEFLDLGIDCLTGGNHSMYQKGCDEIYDAERRLLRPANFPEGTPGIGAAVYDSAAGFPVAVMNFCGRAFMAHFDDPFRGAAAMADRLAKETPIIIFDFHAETTSEKIAMGWFMDGRASAVIGTHTHIQTADERILPKGTAYITDSGMTGPYDSVIGCGTDIILETMLTLRPKRFEVAEPRDVRVCGLFIEVDPMNGIARKVERVRVDLGDFVE